MGSIEPVGVAANTGREQDEEDEVVVLVTGFAPFKAGFPINPSWEIAHTLPPYLPPPSPSTDTDPKHPRIRILVHPSPVRVSYAAVRLVVPQLWDCAPKIDFMIHVGMAGGRCWYSIERRGHREGYEMADVDGVVPEDESSEGEVAEEAWVWGPCPSELETGVDVDDVWRRWRAALPDIDLRPSEDAGRYLCDYIYYSSLAHLWMRGEERRVLFLHVPVESDEAAIAKGREVLMELVRAMVQSRTVKGIVEEGAQKSVA